MYSASSRFNSITITTGITLAVMCMFNFLHNYYVNYQLYNPQPKINFEITSIPLFMKQHNWQQVAFRYNLQADLSSLYTWNLKQLYVYIQATWDDPQISVTSRAIVADWIIQTPSNRELVRDKFRINVTDKSLEYNVRDVYKHLLGNTLKISLNIQYMPFVGIFFKKKLMQKTLQLPKNYTNSRK